MKPNDDQDLQNYNAEFYRTYGIFAGMGVQLVMSVLLCGLAGRWLDQKLATKPLLLICGILLGAVAGFYVLFQTLQAETRRKQKAQHDQHNSTPN